MKLFGWSDCLADRSHFQKGCQAAYRSVQAVCAIAKQSELDRSFQVSEKKACTHTIDPEIGREVIVTLTSFPPRFEGLRYTLETICQQSYLPSRVILWLQEDLTDSELPAWLERFKDRGVEVRFCEDLRSYKKIIFALRHYPEAILVTADDDVFYPPNWLADLVTTHKSYPHCIVCHRAHQVTFDDRDQLMPYSKWRFLGKGMQGPSHLLFPTGVGGVLYPVGCLHAEVLNTELIAQLCPQADDIWLKAMALLADTTCVKVHAHSGHLWEIPSAQRSPRLAHTNVLHGANDLQLVKTLSRWNLQEKLLRVFKGEVGEISNSDSFHADSTRKAVR